MGIIFAKLFNYENKIYIILRILIFTPFILSPIVIGYIFASILTDKGILNSFLSYIYLSDQISFGGGVIT